MSRSAGVLLSAVALSSGCAFWEMSDWSDNAGKAPAAPLEEGGTGPLDASIDSPTSPEGGDGGDAGADAAVLARDAFERSVADGFGTADVGGAWTASGNSDVNDRVEGGSARITVPAAGRGMVAILKSVAARDSETAFELAIDKLPAGGSGLYTSVIARADANSDGYEARVIFRADGVVGASIAKSIDGTANVLPGGKDALTATPGERIRAKFRVESASPTRLRLKVWKATDPEPALWLIDLDDSDAAFQVAGVSGLRVYLAAGTTSLPVTLSFDDLLIRPPTP